MEKTKQIHEQLKHDREMCILNTFGIDKYNEYLTISTNQK